MMAAAKDADKQDALVEWIRYGAAQYEPGMLLHSVEASSEQSCLAWYCILTLPSLHVIFADREPPVFSSGEHRLSMASSIGIHVWRLAAVQSSPAPAVNVV